MIQLHQAEEADRLEDLRVQEEEDQRRRNLAREERNAQDDELMRH